MPEINGIHKITVGVFYATSLDELHQSVDLWQKTPRGEFLTKNGRTFTYKRWVHHNTSQIAHKLIVELESKKLTEYYLKFDKISIK
jgi:hypothetical protein